MPQRIASIPSARRLISSLRNIGYDVHAAVADLVDNSIDAAARQVDVTVRFAGEDSWLRIVDDGNGIPTGLLNEALRWGTDREYEATELGKYGLGLKTASLSVCRRLSVATRTSTKQRRIEIRCWDLDLVERRNQWEMERLGVSEAPEELTEPLRDTPGTVVLWEKLDRILAYRNMDGAVAENGMRRVERQIEEHLAMVFHRFLAAQSARELPLRVTVNGRALDPWDPFALGEQHLLTGPVQMLPLHYDGRDHEVRVQPYVLPAQERFSSTDAWRAASGPAGWAGQQGFYIYRADRLVQSGGWSRLRTTDEHTKLARIAIDIPRTADSAFGLNISKMRLHLPEDLRPQLKVIASAVTKEAQRAYRSSDSGVHEHGEGRTVKSHAGSSLGHESRRTPANDGNYAGVAHALAGQQSLLPITVVEAVLRRELAEFPDELHRVVAALREVTDSYRDSASNPGQSPQSAQASSSSFSGNGAGRGDSDSLRL